MEELGIVLATLAVGLGIGLGLGGVRRRGAPAGGDDVLVARLEAHAAELRRLVDSSAARDGAAESLRTELSGARRALEELAIREGERRERETESWEVVRRLSTVLAGGTAKGRAGENVLGELLAQLPPGMLVPDLRVNGKVVEFALALPDGRHLPIDSKWSAVAELEALEATDDEEERETLARELERVVARRAREVAQYLDPALTAPVAVAAVPDAAYSVLRRAHADAFARGVVIVPYSTALPVLLFLYSLVQRYGDAGDVQACLSEIATVFDAMEGVLENKIARASTMLANGADEFRAQLGKARGSVVRARVGAAAEVPAADVAEASGALSAVP